LFEGTHRRKNKEVDLLDFAVNEENWLVEYYLMSSKQGRRKGARGGTEKRFIWNFRLKIFKERCSGEDLGLDWRIILQ